MILKFAYKGHKNIEIWKELVSRPRYETGTSRTGVQLYSSFLHVGQDFSNGRLTSI